MVCRRRFFFGDRPKKISDFFLVLFIHLSDRSLLGADVDRSFLVGDGKVINNSSMKING